VSDKAMLTGLRSLVSGTVQRLDGLCDHDASWCTPAPGSEAAADLANQETGPAGAWGEQPVRDVQGPGPARDSAHIETSKLWATIGQLEHALTAHPGGTGHRRAG
jgi:hypothetical protein